MHIHTFKHLQIVTTFHHFRKYPYSLQGSDLLKITRNHTVPNYESLGNLHLNLYEKSQYFQFPKVKDSHLWYLGKDSHLWYLGAPAAQPCSTEGIGISWRWQGAGSVNKCMKLNCNFQRGGRVLEKFLFGWKVWIFSGATHFLIKLEKVFNS